MAKPAINILSQLQQQEARIGGLNADSRALRAGDAFVAYPGAAAISAAAAGDVVLIAGKGHEDYLESAGRRIPFLDAAVAAEALAAWSR